MKIYVLIINGENPKIVDAFQTKESAEIAVKELKFPLFKEIAFKTPIVNFIPESILMDSKHNPKCNNLFWRSYTKSPKVEEFDKLFENIKQKYDPDNKYNFKEILKSLNCNILSEDQLMFCFNNSYHSYLPININLSIKELELCSIFE